ncbi:hypothetical protein COO60DRAFT_106935 [Scenedesmus sp. NREL 46B-D3]|nr:hypothetical protein COO60DRAFT_106935 [Scenedesmus sp. NREL 46B-D3]
MSGGTVDLLLLGLAAVAHNICCLWHGTRLCTSFYCSKCHSLCGSLPSLLHVMHCFPPINARRCKKRRGPRQGQLSIWGLCMNLPVALLRPLLPTQQAA